MKILLHICCGPCATYCVEKLRQDGHEVWGFFYNPNIHPYTEYEKRLQGTKQLAETVDLPLIGSPKYGLTEFIREVVFREKERCIFCYQMRLQETARIARKGKFDAFTTTLLISPFQQHLKIKEMGITLGAQYDVPFYYEDFRTGFKRSVTLSKAYNLYRQQYCGCIYSEEDRYHRQK